MSMRKPKARVVLFVLEVLTTSLVRLRELIQLRSQSTAIGLKGAHDITDMSP